MAKLTKPVYGITKRKRIGTVQEALIFFFGSVIYILMFIPIGYYTMGMPEYDTESAEYRKFFARDTHFTTIVHTGKFTLWMIMVVSGYAFVNIVNLLNQRRNPFKGRDGTYRCFITLVFASTVLYFFTPHISLRAPHDMQRDLNFSKIFSENLPEENVYPGGKGNIGCTEPFPVLPVLPSFVRFLIREFSFAFSVFGFPVSSNCCYVYTAYETIFHNMIFIAAFGFGMNYTHLDFPPFSQFGFTMNNLKNFNWIGWLLTIAFVTALIGNGYYVYHVYSFSKSQVKYQVLTAILLLFGIIRTLWLRKTHYIHFHHWTCGVVGLLYFGFQNNYFGILGGVSAGVMVEGASRWGFMPVWKKHDWTPPKAKTD